MVCHSLPTPVRHLPARRTFGVLSAYLGIRNSLEVVTGDSTDAAAGAGHPYPKSANSGASAANTMALTGTDLLTFPELVLGERIGSKCVLFACFPVLPAAPNHQRRKPDRRKLDDDASDVALRVCGRKAGLGRCPGAR
jgi:hypothetical protein